MTGSMSKNGAVADPGLVSKAPGNGVIVIDPVSACHRVSTMAHCFFMTCSSHQSQASGLRVHRQWHTQHSSRTEVSLGVAFTETTKETDGGGSSIEMSYLVF